jgi:hypothetical protein
MNLYSGTPFWVDPCSERGILEPLLSCSTEAALLGVTLEPYPDIFSGFINVGYDAGTDALTANGFALAITTGPSTSQSITAGSFALTATVNDSGVASAGSLTIGGSFGSNSSPLLTATLLDMGWHASGLLDFYFSVTGGSLANSLWFGNPGSVIGVILSLGSNNFSGDWTVNFNNTGLGVADTGIPAPGAALLLLAPFCHGRRRRS